MHTIPTTIIADFHTFLSYIQQQPIKLTKTKYQLGRKDLRALYEQLPNLDVEVGTTATQSGYPVIQLFVSLAVKLKLMKQQAIGSNDFYIANVDNIKNFLQHTDTEQYATLLQCFWMQLDWRALQGALYASEPSNLEWLFKHLAPIPADKKLSLSHDKQLASIIHSYGHFLVYFAYFGLWHVTIDQNTTPKTKVVATAITPTPLFKALLAPLLDAYFKRIFEEEDIFTSITFLQQAFGTEHLQTLYHTPQQPIQRGVYTFKVTFNVKTWCTIALDSTETLLDLHNYIQDGFGLYNDHLYAFYLDNQPFSQHCYNSPMDTEGPYVNDITIEALRLEEGQKILYLYDFGDELQFSVVLMKIQPEAAHQPLGVLQKKGSLGYDYF